MAYTLYSGMPHLLELEHNSAPVCDHLHLCLSLFYDYLSLCLSLSVTLLMQLLQAMAARTDKFVQELKGAAVRVTSDMRDNYTPGWKYNHWELKVSPPPACS